MEHTDKLAIQRSDKSSDHGVPAHNRLPITARGWSSTLWVIWVLAILITVFLIALRLSLPNAERFVPDMERWLHAATGQAISIGSLNIGWRGWTPELVVKDIRLPNSVEDAPSIQSLRAGIGINVLSLWKNRTHHEETSWLIGAIRTKRLLLSGVSLSVIRDSNGALRLAGTEQKTAGLLPWLLQQSHIDVTSANIRWHDEGNEALAFSLRDTRLRIRKNGSHHRIFATLFPYQDHSITGPPTEASSGTGGSLSGMANIIVDPATLHWSGDIFLRIAGFELNRFPLLKNALPSAVAYDIANSGVWTFWDEGQLEYVEGNFTLERSVLTSTDPAIEDHTKSADASEEPGCAPSCAVSEHGETATQEISGFMELTRIDLDNWQLRLRQLTFATSQEQWPATDARMRIALSRNQHGWLLETRHVELRNEDFTMRLAGKGQWFDDHGSPDLRVIMVIDDGKLDKLTQYLPTSLMKKRLVLWLNRAFPKGRIEQGKILFQGRLADFPFDNAEGVFEARLTTSYDTTLKYAEGWLPIHALAADVVFDNRQLTVTTNSGFVYGSKLQSVTAEIPDITVDKPMLTVRGRTVGSLEEGLSFLKTGPLANRHAHRIAGLQGDGELDIDLRIKHQLPYAKAKAQAQGKITFRDSAIKVDTAKLAANICGNSNERHLSFDRINGTLTFDEQGIAGQAIAARYLGQPVTLDVAKTMDRKESGTRFTINGLTTDSLFAYPLLKATLQKVPPALSPLVAKLTDKASWQVTLDLPSTWGRKDNRHPARVGISSPLGGTDADLPVPLARPFRAQMLLSKEVPDRHIT
ncbi:MAG: hypothetical protein KJO08_02855, partial [Gammaproteobacteria bacterium]|nr:hypothetical protein [Gammaproteobacteria bacterium]NNJ83802.1 hypothetical protein [Gammaproteobacteria bacterium]